MPVLSLMIYVALVMVHLSLICKVGVMMRFSSFDAVSKNILGTNKIIAVCLISLIILITIV